MDKQFEELSKSLAEEGVSRREALRKVGFALTGVLLAAVGLNSTAYAGGNCLSDADCPKNSPICCNGKCTDLVDPNNCGACGNRCPQGTRCKVVTAPGWGGAPLCVRS